jgi:hypothetical protein
MQLFGDLDTLSLVRISQLNWIGHVKSKVSQIFQDRGGTLVKVLCYKSEVH